MIHPSGRKGSCTKDKQARKEIMQPPKMPHPVIVRAPGLLPMLYTLGELSQELATPVSTLKDWLDKGLPHQRDRTGHIWVNGPELRAWVESARRKSRGPCLRKGQAYCLKCRQAVKMVK